MPNRGMAERRYRARMEVAESATRMGQRADRGQSIVPSSKKPGLRSPHLLCGLRRFFGADPAPCRAADGTIQVQSVDTFTMPQSDNPSGE